jgi:hypothetical protein
MWKAATVLAGSLVEALLLWALGRRPKSEIDGAVARLEARGVHLPRAKREISDWSLYEYIEVADELAIVSESTTAQTRLAKGFRNLIHPGLEQRRTVKCGRGEALGAIAAVEQVIRDLSVHVAPEVKGIVRASAAAPSRTRD